MKQNIKTGLSLAPLSFDEAVTDILKIKPKRNRDLYFFTPAGQFHTMVIGSGACRRGVTARIR